jgi:hypothetical protein
MFGGRGTFARWRKRRRVRRDEGSMPLAVLVTLVGVTLSAGVSGLVVGQIKDSQRAADRVAAVAAAQAGLDTQLAKIRSSVTSLAGDIGKLPCATSAVTTLSSLGGTTSGTPTYQTSVGYFLVDPTTMVQTLQPLGDLANLNPLVKGTKTVSGMLSSLGRTGDVAGITTAVQSAVSCMYGGLQQVPLFALLRSTGKVGSISRTLYATYTFRTTEETIPGGHIVIAGTNGQLCLGASDPTATTNNYLRALPCTSDDGLVKFIYPKNLSLSLAKSRTSKTAGLPYGLCVTGPATPSDGALVTLTACAATKIPTQQWSYEVNQQTYYGTNDGTTSNNYCLSMLTPGAVNSLIVLKTGGSFCGNAGLVGRAFVPDPFVGAGAAGVGSGQLVNYAEIGRCLDLTNEDPSGGWSGTKPPALITYPCKQAFDGNVFWNHRWTAPAIPAGEYKATGTVSTAPNVGSYAGKVYCMKSPGVNGGFVWVALCSTGGLDLQWTVYEAAPLASEAYQVVDQYGHCLEAAGWRGSYYQYSGWSLVIATTCDGSGLQKWNAPRGLNLSPLTGVQER